MEKPCRRLGTRGVQVLVEIEKKELAKKYTIKNTFRHLVEERIEKWRIFREERKAV